MALSAHVTSVDKTTVDKTTADKTSADKPRSETDRAPVGTLASISLDCSDPSSLADFYGDLLGMRRVFETPDGQIIALSNGGVCVTLMYAGDHVPPTWPGPGQGQQLHMDIAVTDLAPAVRQALTLGAKEADFQAQPDLWRVLLDPAGHPFCLTTVTA